MRPSGRTRLPPIALYRVPSEPQQPALSQDPLKIGGVGGVTTICGAGSCSGTMPPDADGTVMGAWYGAGEPLRGRLMIHDALYGETRVIGVKRRGDCAVCGGALG